MKNITVSTSANVLDNYTGHVKFINGTQYWFKNGRLHREDGLALIWSDGTEFWCLDNQYYSKNNYYRELYKRGIITEQELFLELL